MWDLQPCLQLPSQPFDRHYTDMNGSASVVSRRTCRVAIRSKKFLSFFWSRPMCCEIYTCAKFCYWSVQKYDNWPRLVLTTLNRRLTGIPLSSRWLAKLTGIVQMLMCKVIIHRVCGHISVKYTWHSETRLLPLQVLCPGLACMRVPSESHAVTMKLCSICLKSSFTNQFNRRRCNASLSSKQFSAVKHSLSPRRWCVLCR